MEIIIFRYVLQSRVQTVQEVVIRRNHVNLFPKVILNCVHIVMVGQTVKDRLEVLLDLGPRRNALYSLRNHLLHGGDLVQDVGYVPLDGGYRLHKRLEVVLHEVTQILRQFISSIRSLAAELKSDVTGISFVSLISYKFSRLENILVVRLVPGDLSDDISGVLHHLSQLLEDSNHRLD